jgi:hypothetical protein
MMHTPAGVRRHQMDGSVFVAASAEPARTRQFMNRADPPTAMRQAFINAGFIHPGGAAAA